MYYTSEFIELVNNGAREGFYIGTGNPNAKILIVGKEAAIGSSNDFERHNHTNYRNNAKDWLGNLPPNNITKVEKCWNVDEYLSDPLASNNPLFAFKGVKINVHKEGQTWRKYQKLHDVIIEGEINPNKDREYNFQNNFFLTEMSDAPYKTTSEAQRKEFFRTELDNRRNSFFKSDFIKNFPVIILACSNYIRNTAKEPQITETFEQVKYIPNDISPKLPFWIHMNDERDKLVIHTYQLSGSTASNDLIIQMGKVIRDFMIERSLIVV